MITESLTILSKGNRDFMLINEKIDRIESKLDILLKIFGKKTEKDKKKEKELDEIIENTMWFNLQYGYM